MQLFDQTCLLRAAVAILVAGMTGCGKPSLQAPPPRADVSSAPWFEDVTARAGVDFVHEVELSGQYLFSESIGSGCALLDFDNDGRLDIFLIHNVSPSSRARHRLFRQQPDGRFHDVSAGSGLDLAGWGNGVAVGDVNNDGLPEILITEYDRVRLFLNLGGGKFEDVTLAAGLTNRQWSVPAAFFDYDRDGWLDLVIGNYLDFDPTQRCPDARGQPDFCGPHGFHSTITRLFHNLGTNSSEFRLPHFEDVTVSSGFSRAPGKAMQILCADFDGDRWPDIFITDDGLPNRLFLNQRDGTFHEEAVSRGLAYTGMGAAAANMGIAIGDTDGDGLFDLFVPHLTQENHTLWRQGPRGFFHDATAAAGLIEPPWHGTGFGAVLADFDCDGGMDLAVLNGGVRRRLGKLPAGSVTARGLPPFWQPYAEPAQLFANDGAGRFREISGANPAFHHEAVVGRGLACGDIDNDGAPDLLAVAIAGPARLLRNIASPRGHWLGVRAIDPACGGRDACGAEITARAGPRRWWRLVQPASSYASSNDPRVHFGIGPATSLDGLEVVWPDGSEETFPGGPADRYVTLRKGEGKPVPRVESRESRVEGKAASGPRPSTLDGGRPLPLANPEPATPLRRAPSIDTSSLEPEVARLIESAIARVRAVPESAEAWGTLGSALSHYEFVDESSAAFEQAGRLAPREPRWPYLHALLLLNLDAPAALAKLQRAVELCPVEVSSFKKSEPATFPQPVTLNPELGCFAPRLRLAQELAARGRSEEARAHFDALLRLDQGHSPARLGLAQLDAAAGRPAEAIKLLTACRDNPYTARVAHHLLSAMLALLGDSAGAVRVARRAAVLPADLPWPDPWWREYAALRVGRKARIEQATALLDAGGIDAAVELLTRFTREHPDDEEIWYLLGWAFNERQQGGQAERALREHLRRSPQSPKGHAQLAVALLRQQRYAEAIPVLEAGLLLKPTWRELHSNLGFTNVQLGRENEAIASFRSALDLDPNHVPTYTSLAELLSRRGETDEARRLVRQALELDPANAQAQRLRERLGR